MKKWTMVVNEFVQICQRYKIPTPQFEYSKDEEYTDSELVRLTPDAEPRHVFGHYLVDLHDKEPDIVIKYNKDGSRDMTEVREKIKKEERDSQITSQKNQKKSIDFNKLKPVGNKLDKNK